MPVGRHVPRGDDNKRDQDDDNWNHGRALREKIDGLSKAVHALFTNAQQGRLGSIRTERRLSPRKGGFHVA